MLDSFFDSLPSFVDAYFVSVVAFCALIAYAVYRDRKNIQFYYILLIRKTQRGKELIDRIAQASPRFWKIAATLYVLAAFYFMASGLYLMSFAAKLIIDRTLTVPSLQFILPLPRPQPVSGPGYLLVPFWFWIVLVPFFMLPHEISHGIIARAHKIRLKSVGGLLLAVIPGAFVEPDDRQLDREKPLVKLRVYSAGSIANLAVVLVFALAASQIVWPLLVNDGLLIAVVNETMPAGKAGLAAGMRLERIGGKPVNVEYDDFAISYTLLLVMQGNITASSTKAVSIQIAMLKIMSGYEPNDTIEIVADGKAYNLTLASHPANASMPYMGVGLELDEKKASEFEFSTLLPLLWWVTTMGSAVAIFNLLPIYPLDGGLMVQAVAENIFRTRKDKDFMQKAKLAARIVTIATVSLVAFNFVGPFILQML